ncbi:MAG: hypothetical protein J5I98_36785 [Phaeodactylibacter sp.]|nr:hypothetical protein [Phaeodactylibacter sp.]
MRHALFVLLTFSCLGITPPKAVGQKQGQARIDSLLLELPRASEDTNKVLLLATLSYNYYPINPDEGIKYGNEGLGACRRST